MLSWIAGFWRPQPPQSDLDALRRERRRLQELLACYRDFGFDALVDDAARRIDGLSRRLQELEKSRRSRTP